MEFRYSHIACGGTFDLLHKGHTIFLHLAFKKAKYVSIGVTNDTFNKKLKKPAFQNYKKRARELENFLKQAKLTSRAKVMPLHNIYGTTLVDKTIDALIVSKKTLKGARRIDQARIKRGLVKLPVIVCPQVLAQDNKTLSSTRIRDGEIDRSGQSYLMFLNKIANKTLTDKIRKKLKSPLGPLVKITPAFALKNPPFVAIGDMTVSTFLKNEIVPKISIIDLSINRQKKFTSPSQLGFKNNKVDFTLINPPGVITSRLIQVIKEAVDQRKQKQIIRILGEEDLATIPAILLSPLGTSVYYGQPASGTVMVKITEKTKQDISTIFGLK